MARARVYFTTIASLMVTVDVPDDIDPEERHEAAIEAAYEATPRDICAQCYGWGETWSRDLGEWEVIDDNPVEWLEELDV